MITLNPARFPEGQINVEGGGAFAQFLVSPEAQQAIAEFGREQFGQPLFVSGAGKTEEQLVR